MDPQLQAIIDRALADGASDEDIDLLVQEHRTRTPAEPKSAVMADEDWAKLSVGEKLHNMLGWAGGALQGAFLPGDAGRAALENPGTTLATAAIPGALGVAGKYGGPALRRGASAVTDFISKPSVGSTIGAVEGYRRDGLEGALIGGFAGASGSTRFGEFLKRMGLGGKSTASTKMIQGMSAKPAPTSSIKTVDEMIASAIAKQGAKNPTGIFGTKAPSTPPSASTLATEIAKRDIDWSTTDATPLKMRKGIIRADESQPGLLAEAKAYGKALEQNPGDAAAQAKLLEALKALRQRQHITGGRPSAGARSR
jgi:hypothetical protein